MIRTKRLLGKDSGVGRAQGGSAERRREEGEGGFHSFPRGTWPHTGFSMQGSHKNKWFSHSEVRTITVTKQRIVDILNRKSWCFEFPEGKMFQNKGMLTCWTEIRSKTTDGFEEQLRQELNVRGETSSCYARKHARTRTFSHLTRVPLAPQDALFTSAIVSSTPTVTFLKTDRCRIGDTVARRLNNRKTSGTACGEFLWFFDEVMSHTRRAQSDDTLEQSQSSMKSHVKCVQHPADNRQPVEPRWLSHLCCWGCLHISLGTTHTSNLLTRKNGAKTSLT